MQIEIYSPKQGEMLPPIEWNYEEIKKWLTEALKSYSGLIYTEDTISQAKKDRAALNKLVAAIDTMRKEKKAQYLDPYQAFESQVKELSGLIKRQSDEIDVQIKAFDDARKEEKLVHIKSLYEEIFSDLCELVPYENIHNAKWLNVTFSMQAIEEELVGKAESIRAALASIDSLGLPDDMAAQIKRVYLNRLDLAAALAEKDRIEREQALIKAYEEAKQKHYDAADPDVFKKAKPGDVVHFGCPGCGSAQHEEQSLKIYTVDFRVTTTKEKLSLLKKFLVDNGIQYGKVPSNKN